MKENIFGIIKTWDSTSDHFFSAPKRWKTKSLIYIQRAKTLKFLSYVHDLWVIPYLFHLFGSNPRGRPRVLRTLTVPCRWETLELLLSIVLFPYSFSWNENFFPKKEEKKDKRHFDSTNTGYWYFFNFFYTLYPFICQYNHFQVLKIINFT